MERGKQGISPRPLIRTTDAVALVIGIIVGAGIFRTPSIVAANTGSSELFLLVWLLGGAISLVGALCYAELSTSFPNTGGDYHFLMRAFGNRFAFLFAWARLSIIQTGSIALLAYIVGDYVSQLYPIGLHSSALFAALVVVTLTVINILGVHFGTGTQNLLFAVEFLGTLCVVVVGLFIHPSPEHLSALPVASENSTSIGLALVFVLLTFGGWNEAGYISAELKAGSRKMVWVLVVSILVTTVLYLLVNWAFLRALGIERMATSEAVGIDLMQATLGEPGVYLIGILVVMATLTSINATIFTGARTNYALGRDFKVFAGLGKWNTKVSAPINALMVQGIIALVLIGLGAITRDGFQSMVDFTAPVFWFFFLATGISLFVLRKKEPGAARPFRVPLYPVTPIIFCGSCAYLLYSSLAYTGIGAFVGVAVLALGTLFFFAVR
ncbi:APC family permease [Parapedobacter indicus]|uniref:Amino acid/polyamine/organocation transporter, APC superfamily n=1 Tax=Parapedobacter indicus TaxID=1477437 RepID=A0A1I3R9M4_9SPHI|nr:amino acid permease [Parapedobacter indicus]PPL00378.1 amino acid/polyamine/organocation transporter (APC superfamily) [Parapedobacter indicus]SFJ41896.1 amino acid/polyamine/organocation transporter, APC superfamily [Parapedobacter indicus]